jgi:hypothetical protein
MNEPWNTKWNKPLIKGLSRYFKRLNSEAESRVAGRGIVIV